MTVRFFRMGLFVIRHEESGMSTGADAAKCKILETMLLKLLSGQQPVGFELDFLKLCRCST